MKTMKKIVLFVLVTVMFATQQTFAVPASTRPVNYQLPDGTEITIQLRGDEWVNWAETPDGFTLLLDSEGFWAYAVQNEIGDLKLSGIRAHNEAKRAIEEQIFLKDVPRGLRFSSAQIEIKLEFRRTTDDFLRKSGNDETEPVIGNVRIPVILVGFADRPFTRTKEEIELLLNQPNYTTAINSEEELTGSMYDYFNDVSFGQLLFQADVFGPYALPGNVGYYSYRCTAQNGDTRRMITAVVDSAYEDGADFSDYYLIPGTNRLSLVHVIFAGYCQAAGAPQCHSIWSHKSSIPTMTRNGVDINIYSVSPELRSSWGNHLAHIGTLAHELGHSLLDLPDFYDTDYSGSGGTAVDLGPWCLMASGCDNDNQRTPSNISAWGRVHAGWIQEVILLPDEPQDITLPNPVLQDAVYRINTRTNNEYFLLENRQRAGWDGFIPTPNTGIAGGMLIYHVDLNNSGWNNNCVNCNPARRGNYIKQAGCATLNGCRTGRGTDPWPQSQLDKTEFTDNSVPNSRSWAGANTNKPITNITHNTTDRTVSFTFMAPVDYVIELSEYGTYTFPVADFGYGIQADHTITVANLGQQASGVLTIILSGTHASHFTLSTPSIPNIVGGGTGTFTVRPNTGLTVGIYTATVTVSNTANGISEYFDISFTVRRAAGATVVAPTLADTTFNSITVHEVSAPSNGQTVEYATHRTRNQPPTFLNWQSGPTFSNLLSDTTYYVYARSAQNESYNAGVYAVSEPIRTSPIPANIRVLEANESLKVYPNPVVDGKLIVEIPEDIETEVIQIYDFLGKLVLTRAVSRPKTEIDISHLPNGAYIVKIGNTSTKIVKR
jgi:M6 family metalloprotease-like protein